VRKEEIVRIVQMSDIHVGSGLFRPDLLTAAVEEANALAPDLVAIAGDITMEGYAWEFEEAKGYLDRLTCPYVVKVMGNHDAKNVGYRSFEDLFGMREGAHVIPVPEGEAKVVALDSTKPDLDEGEVGREHYAWLDSEFRDWDRRYSSSTTTSSPFPALAATRTTFATPATLWRYCVR
jgi:3',5'-cyclic AMP phosphodiesterase CpdA